MRRTLDIPYPYEDGMAEVLDFDASEMFLRGAWSRLGIVCRADS